MAAQAQIPSEQKETREKTISHTSLQKTQNKEFLSINACYSVTKYYLCRQNNKRSLLGRKQQSQVARSFPNRYLFSYANKVTSLFSISCILDVILACNRACFTMQNRLYCKTLITSLLHNTTSYVKSLHSYCLIITYEIRNKRDFFYSEK